MDLDFDDFGGMLELVEVEADDHLVGAAHAMIHNHFDVDFDVAA